MSKLTKVQRERLRQERNHQAKIRYNLYRDAGYSIKDAQRMRYIRNTDNPEYLDIKSIKVDSKTNKVIKKDVYKTTLNTLHFDERMDVIRMAYKTNDTTFTYHGYLTTKPKRKDDNAEWKFLRNEYYELVKTIKKYDNLTTDQAFFMAHYILMNKIDYKTARKELLSDEDFQKYVQGKSRKRIRIKGRVTHSRSRGNKRR